MDGATWNTCLASFSRQPRFHAGDFLLRFASNKRGNEVGMRYILGVGHRRYPDLALPS